MAEVTNEETEIGGEAEEGSILPVDEVVIQDSEPSKRSDDDIRMKFSANNFLTPRNDLEPLKRGAASVTEKAIEMSGQASGSAQTGAT